MQIRVLFFGMLKDLVGKVSDSVTLPEGATVGDLLAHYETTFPRLKELWPSIALSVNQRYASADMPLTGNDEIALLPPVSGGAPCTQHAALVTEPIDTQSRVAKLRRPEDGAEVVFEGVVRNNTRGRQTLYLDYEAYEEMALKQMEELATQALDQFKVRDVAIVHRLGRLEIGETSVLIAVASAHRGAAFDACRWLIDTLKRTVPIWKKEYFVDGAVWADGEPFPAEIPRVQGSPSGQPASK
jgi:MoaE-MoaD fusion protein